MDAISSAVASARSHGCRPAGGHHGCNSGPDGFFSSQEAKEENRIPPPPVRASDEARAWVIPRIHSHQEPDPMPLFPTARHARLPDWLKALLWATLFVSLLLLTREALATDGTEFEEAATKFETWIKGNLGKLAALVAVAVGAVVAAVRKEWTWFLGAIVLSVGISVVVGIINASFTATI